MNPQHDLFMQATGGDRDAVQFIERLDQFCARVRNAFNPQEPDKFLSLLAELNILISSRFYNRNAKAFFLPMNQVLGSLKHGENPMPEFVMCVCCWKLGFKEASRLQPEIQRLLVK